MTEFSVFDRTASRYVFSVFPLMAIGAAGLLPSLPERLRRPALSLVAKGPAWLAGAILVVLIIPLPAILLDFALAVSIIGSILILMTSLFIHAPLEFSTFPTVLLITTMLRLGLNVASTRAVLMFGHTGPDAAGKVIESFASFLIGGNFAVGIIVFAIPAFALCMALEWLYGLAKGRDTYRLNDAISSLSQFGISHAHFIDKVWN